MLLKVNAFTEDINGGNPAGVYLNADGLSEVKMLEIAKDIGYSETAFVMKSQTADFKIRYFTPADEVDLCGHATIATFTALLDKGHITNGQYTIETKAGVLPVQVDHEGNVLMNQLRPSFYETIDKSIIGQSLGIKPEDIPTIPQVSSTGLKDIMVHVRNKEVLKNLQPDFEMITNISKQYEVTGYHVFTLDTDKTARCRNFAPLYDIDEESATGTASGAVSGYIIEHKLVETKEGLNHFVFEQGLEMNRPSEIHGYLTIENNAVTQVVIGGKGKIQLD